MRALFQRLQISTLLLGVTGLLLAILAIFSVSSIKDAWLHARQAAQVQAAAAALADTFDALQNTRRERGPVTNALKAPDPASRAFIASIDELRSQSQPAVLALIEACAEITCAKDVTAQSLRQGLTRLDELRKEVDKAFTIPKEDRRKELPADWQAAATTMVNQYEAISKELGESIRLIDPMIAELITIKDAAYSTRDAVGLESTLLQSIVGAGSISPDNRAKMNKLRGKAEAGWAQLEALMSRPGVWPKLKAVHADATKSITVTYEEGRTALLDRVDGGRAAEVDRDG